MKAELMLSSSNQVTNRRFVLKVYNVVLKQKRMGKYIISLKNSIVNGHQIDRIGPSTFEDLLGKIIIIKKRNYC